MTKQYIPNSLRTHRKAAGLRQRDVARALGLASTDRISRWENGVAVPHLKNLFGLAILYHVSPQELYSELYGSILNPASLQSVEPLPEDISPRLE